MAPRPPKPSPPPTPAPPSTPPADPLADLRQDGPTLPPEAPIQGNHEEPAAEDQEEVHLRPMVDQETWDEMVSEMVAAWHQDPTCQGFLHGGGPCGCRYIARQALRVVVPVVTEEDLEEHDLEPVNA